MLENGLLTSFRILCNKPGELPYLLSRKHANDRWSRDTKFEGGQRKQITQSLYANCVSRTTMPLTKLSNIIEVFTNIFQPRNGSDNIDPADAVYWI